MSAPLVAAGSTPAAPPDAPDGPDPGTAADDAATPRPARRRRGRWFPVVAVVLLLASAAVLLLARSTTSATALAPDNPEPGGAMAAARILEREGVRVRPVRTIDAVVDLAGPGTTVLVTGVSMLDGDQLAALRGTDADLVLTQATFALDLSPLTTAVTPAPVGSRDPIPARCADPDAVAADRISRSTGAVRASVDHDVEVCFPTEDGAGAYAVWEEDGRTLRFLADPTLLTNERLADAGNAALVLRALGHHPDLLWYLPTAGDTVGAGDAAPQLLPPEAGAVGLQLGLLVLALAVWRGRRLGRVVAEPLPVVVHAAETTRGRGRLYRRSRAHGHAAAALRAGCAHRTARRLGLPRSAGAGPLLEALSRTTRRPEDELAALLYGPPPTDDAGLLALARALDTLESEVHRP